MAAPVIYSLSASQRDSTRTFLVDVPFAAYDPDGDDLTPTVEWAEDPAGPWTAATVQSSDRRHNATAPLSVGMAAPGTSFNFVWQAFFDLSDGTHFSVYVRLTVDDGALTDQETYGPFTVIAQGSSLQSSNVERSQNRRGELDRTPLDFLGRGMLSRIRRGSSDFVQGTGAELVSSCVRQALNTQSAIGDYPGELKWRMDFGSKLWILKHRNNDPTLEAQARLFVMEALRWESRVKVTEVRTERPPEAPTELRIFVKYSIIDRNVAGNRVIVPDLEEVVTVRMAA